MSSGITEINKETFWQLIEETKNQCGQDMDASISWIKNLNFQYKLTPQPNKIGFEALKISKSIDF